MNGTTPSPSANKQVTRGWIHLDALLDGSLVCLTIYAANS